MTVKWNSTQAMLLFQYTAQASWGTAAVRMEAIELTAHYQYNLSWSCKTTEAIFSVCSAVCKLFCTEKKHPPNNMVTARLLPNRCGANICTRPAVRVEKYGGLDFEHTLTHIKNPFSCLFLHTLPSWCILRIKPISPPAKPSLVVIDVLPYYCLEFILFIFTVSAFVPRSSYFKQADTEGLRDTQAAVEFQATNMLQKSH